MSLFVSDWTEQVRKKIYSHRYSIFFSITASLAVLSMVTCTGTRHRAEYVQKDLNATIAIELFPSHPPLAEYDRFAVLTLNGKEVYRKKLFPDSGGYASSNLYRCNPTTYMLQGYFDTWLIDVKAGTIVEGKCQSTNPEYIGIFEGGGSRAWKFSSSSERKETKLEPKGG